VVQIISFGVARQRPAGQGHARRAAAPCALAPTGASYRLSPGSWPTSRGTPIICSQLADAGRCCGRADYPFGGGLAASRCRTPGRS